MSSQPTPVGSVHVDSGASAVTRESHAHRDRPSQHQPLRNQVIFHCSLRKLWQNLLQKEKMYYVQGLVHLVGVDNISPEPNGWISQIKSGSYFTSTLFSLFWIVIFSLTVKYPQILMAVLQIKMQYRSRFEWKVMLLFSNDTLNCSKVTVNYFTSLRKNSNLKLMWFFWTFLSTVILGNVFWAFNHHIRMMSHKHAHTFAPLYYWNIFYGLTQPLPPHLPIKETCKTLDLNKKMNCFGQFISLFN